MSYFFTAFAKDFMRISIKVAMPGLKRIGGARFPAIPRLAKTAGLFVHSIGWASHDPKGHAHFMT